MSVLEGEVKLKLETEESGVECFNQGNQVGQIGKEEPVRAD